MLYLEDYLEMIEHLPDELRDRFTEMRELDLVVDNDMDNLSEKSKKFFAAAKKMKQEQRDAEFNKIRQEYNKALDTAGEKIEIVNQMHDLVEKYLKRLDSEINKFKIELEADNSGITEILERRSLELDNPPAPVASTSRERKKHSGFESSGKGDRQSSAQDLGIDLSACLSNSLSNSWMNCGNYSGPSSLSPSSYVSMNTNGNSSNTCLTNTLTNSPHSPSLPTSSRNQIMNPANLSLRSSLSYNIGVGNTAIAAAASQAIAATQQMQQGRRTASLKASYEAINAGLQNISCDFSALREGTLSSSLNAQGATFHSGEGPSSGITKFGKRSRNPSQLLDNDESSDAMTLDENGTPDWTYDPNEPRYCLCNQVSYGDMVACDNIDCQYEWFHYGCVGISQSPRGKWFCPSCTLLMKKKNRKDKQ